MRRGRRFREPDRAFRSGRQQDSCSDYLGGDPAGSRPFPLCDFHAVSRGDRRADACVGQQRTESFIGNRIELNIPRPPTAFASDAAPARGEYHGRFANLENNLLAGKLSARRKDCAPLAGKSTLNRLELGGPELTRYHRIAWDGAKIEALFVDLFVEAHQHPPPQIILDLDATDDPLHGHQEGRFFHGYYDCSCYLPLYIFCGEFLLSAQLRSADIDPAKGALTDLKRVVAQIRRIWPRVHILVRGDSGFCRDAIMDWCERQGIDYVFGLAKNPRLLKEIGEELKAAETESVRTGTMARIPLRRPSTPLRFLSA